MRRLCPIFDFITGKLNILQQVDFCHVIAGHLGWRMRQQAIFKVCFFGNSVSKIAVFGLLLGLQNYRSLEVLVYVWLLLTETRNGAHHVVL